MCTAYSYFKFWFKKSKYIFKYVIYIDYIFDPSASDFYIEAPWLNMSSGFAGGMCEFWVVVTDRKGHEGAVPLMALVFHESWKR